MSGGVPLAGYVRRLHPLLVDALLVALAAALLLLELRPVFGDSWIGGPFSRPDAVAYPLYALIVGPLLLRRRYPVGVAAAVLGASYAYQALAYPPLAALDLSALVAIFSAAAYGRRLATPLGLATIAVWLLAIDVTRPLPFDLAGLVVLLVVFAGAWVLGEQVRAQRGHSAALEDRAALLERERELEAERAVTEERARIARELHDVVAHNISVAVVQAEAAAVVLDDDPAAARTAIVAVQASGRGALAEMRRLLGVLRLADDGREDDRGPQPTIDDLDALIGQVRDAGLAVEVEVGGERRPLPVGVELSAYRIVQEALTNSLKHARQAAGARVSIHYGASVLDIEVRDDGRATAGRDP